MVPKLIVELEDCRTRRGGRPATAAGLLRVRLVRPNGRETIAMDTQVAWPFGAAASEEAAGHIAGFKAAMQQQYGESWTYEETAR